MGGCIYLYVDEKDREQATEILNNLDGVDLALSRKETANRFRLMGSRIGDIMALGAADVVFGDPAEVTIPSGLRSHGSLYEVMVTVIGCGLGISVGSSSRRTRTWDAMFSSGSCPDPRTNKKSCLKVTPYHLESPFPRSFTQARWIWLWWGRL